MALQGLATDRAAPEPAPGAVRIDSWAPRDGRLRCGLASPSIWVGGAEFWMLTLLEHARNVNWAGVALPAGALAHPAMMAKLRAAAPVRSGEGAVASLASDVDVLIAWGMPDLDDHLPPPDERTFKLVVASHGIGPWTRASMRPAAGADGIVAVSRCAMLPIPEELHPRTTILYNGVPPERVVPRRTREAQLREWGLTE